MTVDQYYKEHKAEILKLVGTEHLSQAGFENLKYEFTDGKGLRWYSYTAQMSMPVIRVLKNQEYLEWMYNGMSPEDFRKIRLELVTCMAHINSGSKESKDYARKAGMLIHEMDVRQEVAQPFNVLCNFIANNLVREDENPKVWSGGIHEIKTQTVEDEIMDGNNDFFLFLPQLNVLSEMQNMSQHELMAYLVKLRTQAERNNHILNQILSMKGVGNVSKTPKRPS